MKRVVPKGKVEHETQGRHVRITGGKTGRTASPVSRRAKGGVCLLVGRVRQTFSGSVGRHPRALLKIGINRSGLRGLGVLLGCVQHMDGSKTPERSGIRQLLRQVLGPFSEFVPKAKRGPTRMGLG